MYGDIAKASGGRVVNLKDIRTLLHIDKINWQPYVISQQPRSRKQGGSISLDSAIQGTKVTVNRMAPQVISLHIASENHNTIK